MRIDRLLMRLPVFELAIAASVMAHVGALRSLPSHSLSPASSRSLVAFRVAEPKPLPPLPPEPPPPPELPKPKPKPALPKRATAREEERPVEPPPPPVGLSGRTLTAEGAGASFEAPAGDGSERSAPIQAGPATSPPPKIRVTEPRPQAPAPKKAEVTTVPLKDLRRRPEAPALASALARNYPDDLRRRGQGGEAIVRARVDADGRVRVASVASESDSGFGAACQRTLVGSTWSPPLGPDGAPVATWIRYTCRFRVGL